jgi:2-aminoethylphosphonate-pyruvate transaminase
MAYERMVLLNPGPANTTQAVKQALVCEDICPRETVFGDVMGRVADRLARIADPSGKSVTVLFGGSGTAGVEAAIASAVPKDGRLLVLDNGAYGARMTDIAKAYGMPHESMVFGVGARIDIEQVKARLERGDITQVAVVHHETTTGMLNPVEKIGALCKIRKVELIVDAMSSFAGIPFTMESLGADFVVSSSNKCIQGMAGLAFVIGKKERIESMRHVAGRSLYLSVGDQYRFFRDAHQMRFTPPVQLLYALERAIDELDAEGGVEARRKRYDACYEVLDRGVRAIGFERLMPDEDQSRILTAYVEPNDPKYSYDRMHDLLFERGFTIYPGKGAKVGTFRLANMGDITPDDMERFVAALRETVAAMDLQRLTP